MPERVIKIPGPDHPITVASNPSRIVVRVAGRVIADLAFFRGHFGERLIANAGVVLVFVAFWLRFGGR